jgi:hypothetical protein
VIAGRLLHYFDNRSKSQALEKALQSGKGDRIRNPEIRFIRIILDNQKQGVVPKPFSAFSKKRTFILYKMK